MHQSLRVKRNSKAKKVLWSLEVSANITAARRKPLKGKSKALVRLLYIFVTTLQWTLSSLEFAASAAE